MAEKPSLHQTKTHRPPLSLERLKQIQKSIRLLLYYARAVDNKLLVALNATSARQAMAMVHNE
jgi:hypothetical protein